MKLQNFIARMKAQRGMQDNDKEIIENLEKNDYLKEKLSVIEI